MPFTGRDVDASRLRGGCVWADFSADAAQPVFEPMPFAHPVYIMYSSGTTGVPKCIVHGAGGSLLQHLKEHQLHCDVQEADRLFYFTTCGWIVITSYSIHYTKLYDDHGRSYELRYGCNHATLRALRASPCGERFLYPEWKFEMRWVWLLGPDSNQRQGG